jgi:hypothetical protein
MQREGKPPLSRKEFWLRTNMVFDALIFMAVAINAKGEAL